MSIVNYIHKVLYKIHINLWLKEFKKGKKTMARKCNLTGKAVLVGNKVSHSNRKTKKRFLPNLQETSLSSDILASSFRMRVSTNAIRSIEVNGGLDNYLISSKNDNLSSEALSIKKRIKKAFQSKE